jgi:hypothetical protein
MVANTVSFRRSARSHAWRCGFTLAELMLAIGLGSVICYAAYASLRVASSSVATVNRLSLDNQLLRAGVTGALDDLDFWLSQDDPDGAVAGPRQVLRAPGLAFSPLDLGADDRNLRFDPSHPRSWFRGNPASIENNGFGDHALFTKLGHPDVDHRWHPTMVHDISAGLGYYALTDYLPANTLLTYYEESGDTAAEMRYRYDAPPTENQYYYWLTTIANCWQPRDRQNTTCGCIFLVTTDRDYISWNYQRRFFWNLSKPPTSDTGVRLYDFFDYSAASFEPDKWGADRGALERTAARPIVLDPKPAHWSNLDIRVCRFATNARHIASAKVIVSDPVTGKQTKLYFQATATTLRGARQQRRHPSEGGGWIDHADPAQHNLDLL